MIKGEDKYCVYVHTFPNGKRYVGQCKEPAEHRWQSGNGYSRQPLIHNAIVKYGWDNTVHEIVYSGISIEDAWEKEILLIGEYNTNALNGGDGYNMSNGGESGSRGYKHTDEYKRRASELIKGANNPYYGKTHTEQTKQKISAVHKGKIMSQESRSKMSQSRTGDKHFQYGIPRSEEIKKKLSEANKVSQRFQDSVRGRNHVRAKAILCVETNVIYGCLSEIKQQLGIDGSSIYQVCAGKRKTAYGCHWQHVSNDMLKETKQEEINA